MPLKGDFQRPLWLKKQQRMHGSCWSVELGNQPPAPDFALLTFGTNYLQLLWLDLLFCQAGFALWLTHLAQFAKYFRIFGGNHSFDCRSVTCQMGCIRQLLLAPVQKMALIHCREDNTLRNILSWFKDWTGAPVSHCYQFFLFWKPLLAACTFNPLRSENSAPCPCKLFSVNHWLHWHYIMTTLIIFLVL